MTALSIALLLGVLLLCTVALYSHAYRDNWGQCLGLVLLALWCAAEIAVVLQGDVPPRAAALYLGLAAYAAGTARKVMHHHGPRKVAATPNLNSHTKGASDGQMG